VSNALVVRNRQRRRRINSPLLRSVARALVEELCGQAPFHVGVYIVGAPEIVRLNEQFVRHAGVTDVITFDYSDPGAGSPLHSEVFVCVDEAEVQARRFGTSWQRELTRYIAHGLLHLTGHDDHRPSDRRRMKQAEDRLLRLLESRFRLQDLGLAPRGRKGSG
jgi:probable rRNA maturation factor